MENFKKPEKLDVAHATPHIDKDTEKALHSIEVDENLEARQKEEDLESNVKGRPAPKSLSSQNRGGEYGTPKFKEKLKLKNFINKSAKK